MLSYKGTSLLLVLVLIIMASVGIVRDIPLPFFLIPVLIYIGILVYGSAAICSGFFIEVVCAGDPAVPEVALTFDDGPDATRTPRILDILKENEVPAAFFCIGEKINDNQDLLNRIHQEGHIIGNHSYSHHFFFDLFTYAKMVREIRAVNRNVEKVINKRMFLFRPPYGVTTPALSRAIKFTKVTPVGWSLRSMDTVTGKPEQLVQKVTSKLKQGDIILLHDTAAVTVDALPQIIHHIREKGYKIVRVDVLLKTHAYA